MTAAETQHSKKLSDGKAGIHRPAYHTSRSPAAKRRGGESRGSIATAVERWWIFPWAVDKQGERDLFLSQSWAIPTSDGNHG